MPMIFLWEFACCRGVLTHSLLLCSLQCHHIFHLKIQGEEHVYYSSIRNSLSKCLVGEGKVSRKSEQEMGLWLVLLLSVLSALIFADSKCLAIRVKLMSNR